jgi:hypothetical protein
MRAKQLPELDYLNEIFVLRNDGKLIWQTRPVSHFQTLTSCKSWNTKYVGKEAGSIKQGYRRLRINGDEYLAHRVAYYMFWGDIDDELEIDHLDGNGLNNSLDNLRLVSHGENMKNARLNKQNTTGVQGVSNYAKNGKFRAQIKVNGKVKALGYYDTIEEAAAVREAANEEYNYSPNHGAIRL